MILCYIGAPLSVLFYFYYLNWNKMLRLNTEVPIGVPNR